MGVRTLCVPYRTRHNMESVDDLDAVGSVQPNDQAPRTKTNTTERAVIGKAESEKLSAWLTQLSSGSLRFIAVTKSDLVNFLIRAHRTELTSKEMGRIRSHNYNPVRHMNWIAQELKDALNKNDMARVATLQDEIKGIELSVISQAREANDSSVSNTASAPKAKRTRANKMNSHAEMKRPSGASAEISDE